MVRTFTCELALAFFSPAEVGLPSAPRPLIGLRSSIGWKASTGEHAIGLLPPDETPDPGEYELLEESYLQFARLTRDLAERQKLHEDDNERKRGRRTWLRNGHSTQGARVLGV